MNVFLKSLIFAFCLIAKSQADIYDDCGENNENCFGISEFESDLPTCLAQKDCKVIASFNRVDENSVKFQIQAEFKGIDENTWVGLGLSLDGGMGNDAVVACYGTTVANYWNNDNPYYSFILDDPMNGLSDVSVSVVDGKLSCSFVRAAVTNLVLPMDLGEATIDLNSVEYFIELATGPLDGSGLIAPHQDQEVSENAVKF